MILLAILPIFLISCNKRGKEVPANVVIDDVVPQPETVNGFQRFLKVTEFNDTLLNRVVRDTMAFDMNRRGDSIKGSLLLKPYEKDKKLSTYEGVINGNSASVIAVSFAEGEQYKEELFFTLTDSAVAIKFGEMVKGKNDTWYYKNKNTAHQEVLERVE